MSPPSHRPGELVTHEGQQLNDNNDSQHRPAQVDLHLARSSTTAHKEGGTCCIRVTRVDIAARNRLLATITITANSSSYYTCCSRVIMAFKMHNERVRSAPRKHDYRLKDLSLTPACSPCRQEQRKKFYRQQSDMNSGNSDRRI